MTSSFVGYYRQLSHAIFGVPAELLGIMIPRSLIDFWALSFVCAGAYARSNNVKYALAFRGLNFKSPSKKLRIAVFLVFGFSGAGLFVPLSALSITTYVRDDITRDALKNLIVVMVVLGGFFILNAFSPSAPNV